jgi:hypothetical protein
MAANPLARFCATYHGDSYTLRLAMTRFALSEHHLMLREIARAWNPRNEFEQSLRRIALRSVPLIMPKSYPPTLRVCKMLQAALGVKTQEMLNRQTVEERAGWSWLTKI